MSSRQVPVRRSSHVSCQSRPGCLYEVPRRVFAPRRTHFLRRAGVAVWLGSGQPLPQFPPSRVPALLMARGARGMGGLRQKRAINVGQTLCLFLFARLF